MGCVYFKTLKTHTVVNHKSKHKSRLYERTRSRLPSRLHTSQPLPPRPWATHIKLLTFVMFISANVSLTFLTFHKQMVRPYLKGGAFLHEYVNESVFLMVLVTRLKGLTVVLLEDAKQVFDKPLLVLKRVV